MKEARNYGRITFAVMEQGNMLHIWKMVGTKATIIGKLVRTSDGWALRPLTWTAPHANHYEDTHSIHEDLLMAMIAAETLLAWSGSWDAYEA